MGPNLLTNYGEAVAMILFVIGFSNLLLQKNLNLPKNNISLPNIQQNSLQILLYIFQK